MWILTRRLAVLAAAAVLTAVCAACGSSPGFSPRAGTSKHASASKHAAAGRPGSSSGRAGAAFPVTIAAANGLVQVRSRPTAIISLAPTATEMLYAIGAGNQVRAVDDDSDYPPQAPRTKLSGLTPNIEAIVSYKPDLVVISNNIGGLVRRLAAFSIPVLELPAPASLAGEYAEFDQLGKATGHLAQAQREDASLRAQLKAIAATVPHHARPLTYYYELGQDYYSLTSDTFFGRLLGLLGMKSIADAAKGAAAAGGYPQLSAEYVLKAQPDYIILADTVCCHQSAATVAKRPGWSALSAVKKGRIIAVNDDIASRWGPRIVDLLRDVASSVRRSGDR